MRRIVREFATGKFEKQINGESLRRKTAILVKGLLQQRMLAGLGPDGLPFTVSKRSIKMHTRTLLDTMTLAGSFAYELHNNGFSVTSNATVGQRWAAEVAMGRNRDPKKAPKTPGYKYAGDIIGYSLTGGKNWDFLALTQSDLTSVKDLIANEVREFRGFGK
jgi:hypothetical protein